MSISGNGNVLLGAGAALPTTNGDNQIVLGTANSSLFIQGSLNFNVGATTINGVMTLPTPFAQFYLVNSTVGSYQITLPPAALPTCKGATVTFRRDNSTPTNLTFGRSGSDLLYPAIAKDGASSITFTAGQFQTQFISDGTSWYQVYVA